MNNRICKDSLETEPGLRRSSDLSLWFLLFSNIVAIYFAITENWNLSTIMLVYCFQSITIGFFNFIRILQLKEFSTEGFIIKGQPAQPTKETKIFAATSFLFSYGFSHLIYMILLFTGFTGIFTKEYVNAPNFNGLKYILLTSLLFFINHLFSYFYNRPKDTKKQNISLLMYYPYVRIIPMHLTIMIGSTFGDALFLFLILKTFADVIMHIVEHNVLRKGELPKT